LHGKWSSFAAAAAVATIAATALGATNGGSYRLTGTGEVHRGEFGWSVALSRDGRTAVVGAPNDDSPTFDSPNGVLSQGPGAVWAFTRSGARWRALGPKLVGRGGIGPAQFGAAVALSADGRTLLVGAPADSGGAGAAWIFTRRGATWQPYRRKLTGRAGDGFGASVALSDSGRLALIGSASGAWVYARRGSVWVPTARLAVPGQGQATQFGKAVALAGDGSIALVGAPGADGGSGASWLFVRHAARWQALDAKLTGSGADGPGGFGRSVALSGDGTSALVGAPVDANGAGAAWLFRVGPTSWSPLGKKLTGAGETGPGQFGDSVALSANGKTALVGGALDADGRGAAWALGPDGAVHRLQPAGLRPSSELGDSVALSGAGRLALVGSVGEADFVGAAWAFSLRSF
jgi:hypothetical protein